jgi:hypothetical protein
LGFQSRCSIPWATPPVHSCTGYFGDWVSWTIFWGCPWTTIFLISASQVARIIGPPAPSQNFLYLA